jgi:hypothetical protein
VTDSNSRWIALTALVFAATLAACGSSSPSPTTGGATSTPTPPASAATPTIVAASSQCPSGAAVGSALGTTLPDAVGVAGAAGAGGPPLPGGAIGLVCDYHTTSENVIIVKITNISASYMSQFSKNFPSGGKAVSGVGDQARSFYVALGGGKDNEGVVATKGSTIVSIGATATPASLSQVEALVNQLL